MKKIINTSILALCALLVFTACDDVELVQIDPNANVTVMLSETTVTLTEDTATDNTVVVSWDEPDFGFNAAPTYNILIDVEGGDFANAQIIPVATATEKTFTVSELNNKLLTLGLTPNTEDNVNIKIEVTLSDSQKIYSNTAILAVTPYSSLLDLTSSWGLVGSATPGAWGTENIPDLPLYTTGSAGVLVAYVTLRDGEIKFRENNEWINDYGDTDADGSLDAGGTNIPVTAGTYKITMNLNDFTWSMEDYTWGLVGDATTNAWDGPDMMLAYNPYQDNWKAVVTLGDGEFKFRFNNDWGLNYGDDGVDGTLDNNGTNITVTAGHYLVTLDLNALEYTLEPMDVWGLVGDGTVNAWDGPDQKFVPDFGINEGTFYINGAVLTNGFAKVRQNDAWALNYGDDGNDGTLEVGGADIPVTAGTYNITVNFAVEPPTITMYQWQ
ncbi:SusE domain-containing protein [Lacinutrix undariae]